MEKKRLRRGLLGALALGVIAGVVPASDLKLDGRASIRALMNGTVTLTVTGAPNLPVWLFLDVSAGPVMVLGQSLPIGFTPSMLIVLVGNTDASGTLSLPLPIPSFPPFHGATLYLLAAVQDPSFPYQLDFSNGADFTIVDRNVELAGNSLAQFPFFEHIRAINEGSSVEVGVDPGRYPFAVGLTADVYVVAAKTRDEWITDSSLVDVNGGPVAMTIQAGTVEDNTAILDLGALDGTPAGDDLGVGYDVVIDLDRDGSFGGLDLADGYSDEAGFYVVHDLTQPGPHAVREVIYSGGAWLGQDLYYPVDIDQMGLLPLVVVSHGNGHNYQWYDHIGYHLASYGYIVMSHQNNTMPGSHTAALTTLFNTDYILQAQAEIDGGALNGHIDANRIIWIGHSRGADGVVRAYDQLFDGTFTPDNFDRSDIVFISSIAPVDFGGTASSNPHDANFHLWVGQADDDVHGCANTPSAQPYHLLDRAQKTRQSISIYGAGHGDFHNGLGSSVAAGPCLIGRQNVHLIMKGHLLALLAHQVRGNVPAFDYLWRQYDVFRPIGAPTDPCVTVNLTYRGGSAADKHVIDDFQTNASNTLASSGALVDATVTGLDEGKMRDTDLTFAWAASDIFNGFTYGRPTDVSSGGVFNFDGLGDYHLGYSVTRKRFCDFAYLSFRAAQGTRHPLTTAEVGDLTFTVTLFDGSGRESSIGIGSYGGGIEEPYQRRTCGAGVGWNSEFETIRIRLADFASNDRVLDLADIVRVEFRFGPTWGSPMGRLGVDDIELVVQ